MAALHMTQQTITIELQLMKPLVTFRRFRNESRQLRRHKLGHCNLPCTRKILNLFGVHCGGTQVARTYVRCTRRNSSTRSITWSHPEAITHCVDCASAAFRWESDCQVTCTWSRKCRRIRPFASTAKESKAKQTKNPCTP